MHWINWVIVVAYLGYVVIDGIRRSKDTDSVRGYLLANKGLNWWVVGLSVMATQLSAITMIGTPGQGATEGIRFVQFYFGLPLAMVILGVTLVPFLHRSGVYTAYEFLERRFDARTRSFTALLFLLSRGMSAGVIIAAPAVVLSAIFNIPLTWAVGLVVVPTALYTMAGGVQAIAYADVKQMVLIVASMVAVAVVLLLEMPVPPDEALRVAGATGHMQAFDFSFRLDERYTVWAGLIGGTFLMMSYFGTDQSQVQRYLTAKSVDEARSSLMVSAYWKIPLQALILLVGVLVFVYYQFAKPPLLYNPAHEAAVVAERGESYQELDGIYTEAWEARAAAARALAEATEADAEAAAATFVESEAAVRAVRDTALALAEDVTGENPLDVNYIMPHFVLNELPVGLVGLFIAGVLAAAMSSIAAELNALATTSVIDFYRRWVKPEAEDSHYLKMSRWATGLWCVFAGVVALYAVSLGSLIEVVNRFGSFFYGSILGVFLLAMIPRAGPIGAFVGLLAGMGTVGAISEYWPDIAFLWHNVIGAVTVVAVGMAISALWPGARRTS